MTEPSPDRSIPDGVSNPMTDDDLILVRKYRPDFDEKLIYANAQQDDD